jgi:hypothetical protein
MVGGGCLPMSLILLICMNQIQKMNVVNILVAVYFAPNN